MTFVVETERVDDRLVIPEVEVWTSPNILSSVLLATEAGAPGTLVGAGGIGSGEAATGLQAGGLCFKMM